MPVLLFFRACLGIRITLIYHITNYKTGQEKRPLVLHEVADRHCCKAFSMCTTNLAVILNGAAAAVACPTVPEKIISSEGQ